MMYASSRKIYKYRLYSNNIKFVPNQIMIEFHQIGTECHRADLRLFWKFNQMLVVIDWNWKEVEEIK